MLQKIITELIQSGRPTKTKLPRGLYLSYQPGQPHTLTAYRLNQWPSPVEIKIVLECVGHATRRGAHTLGQTWEKEMRTAVGKQYGCIVISWPDDSPPIQSSFLPERNHNYANH